jgi:alpha-ribazole phosphatase
MDIYLIRHSRPDLAADTCYGRFDAALPANFRDDVQHLPQRLPAQAPILTCDAQRCRTLASFLATALHSTVSIDTRLQDLDFGRWEGQLWSDIPQIQTRVWSRDVWNSAPPDGETYTSLHARVSAAWEALLLNDSEQLIVVGNGGPLRALMTIALELPADSFLRFNFDYAGMSKLSDASGGWRLEFANR